MEIKLMGSEKLPLEMELSATGRAVTSCVWGPLGSGSGQPRLKEPHFLLLWKFCVILE